MRDKPKSRIYPRERPVIAQRFLRRTGDEFFGSFCKAAESPAALNAARFSAYLATSFTFLASRASWDVFAIKIIAPKSVLREYQRFTPESTISGIPMWRKNASASAFDLAEVTIVIANPKESFKS